MEIGGQRPPDGQPSLDREGVSEADGWDDEWMICICDSAVSTGIPSVFPPPLRGAPLSRVAFPFRLFAVSRFSGNWQL